MKKIKTNSLYGKFGKKRQSKSDVFHAARTAAYKEVSDGFVEDPKFLMAALDNQATRLRFAVRKGIPTSVRAEARSLALILAMLDHCFHGAYFRVKR